MVFPVQTTSAQSSCCCVVLTLIDDRTRRRDMEEGEAGFETSEECSNEELIRRERLFPLVSSEFDPVGTSRDVVERRRLCRKYFSLFASSKLPIDRRCILTVFRRWFRKRPEPLDLDPAMEIEIFFRTRFPRKRACTFTKDCRALRAFRAYKEKKTSL